MASQGGGVIISYPLLQVSELLLDVLQLLVEAGAPVLGVFCVFSS